MLQREDLQVRLAAPYQLNPKPEVQELGFGKYFTDHMLKVTFDKQLGGWQKPEITPFENLSIHPAAKGLHYAIQVREGSNFTIMTLSLKWVCVSYAYYQSYNVNTGVLSPYYLSCYVNSISLNDK